MQPEKRMKHCHHNQVIYTPNWMNKDVLCHIFRNLRVLDVERVAGVCKLFYDCCQDNLLWFQFLCEQLQVDYTAFENQPIHLPAVPPGHFKKLYKHCFPQLFSVERLIESLRHPLPLHLSQDVQSLHEVNQLLETHIKSSRMLKNALFTLSINSRSHWDWSKKPLVLLDYFYSSAKFANGTDSNTYARYNIARKAKLSLKPLRFFEILIDDAEEYCHSDNEDDPFTNISLKKQARMIDYETRTVTTVPLEEDEDDYVSNLKKKKHFQTVVEFLGHQKNDCDDIILNLMEKSFGYRCNIYRNTSIPLDKNGPFGFRSDDIEFCTNILGNVYYYEEKCRILQEILQLLQESSISPGSAKELYSIASSMKISYFIANVSELGEQGYNIDSSGRMIFYSLNGLKNVPIHIDYQYSVIYGFGMYENVYANMNADSTQLFETDNSDNPCGEDHPEFDFSSNLMQQLLEKLSCKETTVDDLALFFQILICTDRVSEKEQGCAQQIVEDFQQIELPFEERVHSTDDGDEPTPSDGFSLQ